MLNKILATILLLIHVPGFAAEDYRKPQKILWPFDGIVGKVDKRAAQRGFQVYREVCSACHGVRLLSYRNLSEIGFSEAEIKEIAKNFSVIDGPDDSGEMFERPAIPSDRFVGPYPNEEAARASNNGALPHDLSLIIKARENGANYLYSLLTGYSPPPTGFEMEEGLYYNPYFPGQQIAMPPPLVSGQVEYIDGTRSSIEQMSRDVVIFLQWASEPEMQHRKSLGLKTMIFLFVITTLFYLLYRKIWSDVEK